MHLPLQSPPVCRGVPCVARPWPWAWCARRVFVVARRLRTDVITRAQIEAAKAIQRYLDCRLEAAGEAVDLLTEAEIRSVLDAAEGRESATLAIAAIVYRARMRTTGKVNPLGRDAAPELTAVAALPLPGCDDDNGSLPRTGPHVFPRPVVTGRPMPDE